MSYDLEIWSVEPVSLRDALGNSQDWQQAGDSWSYGKRNWQMVVNASDRVLLEDIPEEIVDLLPGIQHVTELNLEPVDAPKSASTMLRRVAKKLAKQARGIIVDEQRETVETPSGVRRLEPGKRQKTFSILTMSWWFDNGRLDRRAGLDELVGCFERLLPEALPRRYGTYEPPKHVYANTGRDHFLDFLRETLFNPIEMVIWYPQRPVVNVHLLVYPGNERGATPRGFAANQLEVEIDASALDQPGWPLALRRLWRELSRLVRPFYGDVRTLGGFTRGPGGRAYLSDNTEEHPVCGPWWNGIPKTLGQAVVLGEPYHSLWPDFVTTERGLRGLSFASTADWRSSKDLTTVVGKPAAELVQRTKGRAVIGPGSKTYPKTWPFAGPYSDE